MRTLRQLLADGAAEQVTDEVEPRHRYCLFEVLLNAEKFKRSLPRKIFSLQFYLEFDSALYTQEERDSAMTELIDYVLDFHVDWTHRGGLLGIDVIPDIINRAHQLEYYDPLKALTGSITFLSPGKEIEQAQIAALKASLRMVLLQSLSTISIKSSQPISPRRRRLVHAHSRPPE